MAETIVKLVLGKLADAVVQEALFLSSVRDKVERVQRDLKWIQSFLKDADTKRHKDERVKQWVNEVQEVGYLIEDVLEKFLAEVGGGRPGDLPNILKGIGKMPIKLIAKHNVGNEIDKIQERIREIRENTINYGIESLNETSSGASTKQLTSLFVHPDIDEMEVVGFEVDRKIIVDLLIDTNVMRRSVISIVGAGGSGKSTLAKEVYKSAEVKRHFGSSCMWLTISQDYKLIDILMKMLKEIGSERRNEGEEYLITELNKCMRDRKYLIILDDVWSSNNIWTQLQAALPNANNGSRVLITTRFIEIAEVADIISKPHEMKPLNEEESKQLFLKKVFPNQFANECPNDLLPLATQFTKKCGGWPLALMVVGGILSRKNPNYITWDEVMQKMDWHIEGSIYMGVISTSYEDLPFALKPCFMYFGVFPEDYQIKATTLFQLWIAEGFIRQDGKKSLEDIAESYLEELVQRCMVQVSRRSWIGKIKYCHIHDLLRDLAIQKAKEDNFLTVISKNDTMLSSSIWARRVALHDYGNKMIEHNCTNLRSLINFGDVPNFNRFGMLRVLLISKVPYGDLYGAKCLKYLRLEGDFRVNCMYSTGRIFKRSHLTYMKNLQTVRIWVCKRELPLSFWDNKQLRHINLSCCGWCETLPPEGPPPATNLQSLVTLKGVSARQDWVAELPHFPYIRKLGIVIPEGVAWEPFINLLSTLNHLGSLRLKISSNKRMTFPYCISAFRNHNRLHSLKLVRGIWPRKVVDCTLFPPHLVKLRLKHIIFEEDPMPQLEKLPNLKVLELSQAVDAKKMICSTGGFGCLQRMLLRIHCLKEWKIEEGALPMLNQLLVLKCWELWKVPNLQYLTNLQEFTAHCLNPLKSQLQGEDQWKIKHIPSVIIY